MSLIPYHPREGREIVLRHRNAVVVRDRDSQRLEIRGSECPTCHQPWGNAPKPERSYERAYEVNHEFVDPEYFRMLRTGDHSFARNDGPPSPVRRLVEPPSAGDAGDYFPYSTTASSSREETPFAVDDPESPQTERAKIRRNAFSPNYFKTFFVEERILGRGGKGIVLLVRHEIDGCPLGHFACKRVPVGDDHGWLEKALIEVELLAKLSHPNLVSYRHVWLEDVRLTRFGPSVACAFILQQYCNGGDLHQYVLGGLPREITKEDLKAQMRRRSRGQADMSQAAFTSRPQLSFEEIYSLFRDITSGVAYLHGANYIHRDLKPSNCLLHQENAKLMCLISDFGEVQAENMDRKSTGSTGTISYCAPEVLRMDSSGRYANFTTKSDIFSLGMILYFMCFGRLPYRYANSVQEELEDIDQLRAEITDWEGFQDERQQRPDLPSKLYRLLKKMLALNPAERPSANEVLSAMRRETSFDNIAKEDWPSAVPAPIRGNRIQNLDSPVPPATPVAVQREHQRGPFRNHSEATVPIPQAPNGEKAGREGAPARDIIAAHDRGSPGAFGAAEGGDKTASPTPNGTAAPAEEPDEQRAPRLLMAPPRTPGREFWHQLTRANRCSVAIQRLNTDTFDFMLRSAIFLGKLATLTQPCWPYVASLDVALPLIIIATAELGWSGFVSMDWTASREFRDGSRGLQVRQLNLPTRAVLLGLHFGIIWMARRWEILCTESSRD